MLVRYFYGYLNLFNYVDPRFGQLTQSQMLDVNEGVEIDLMERTVNDTTNYSGSAPRIGNDLRQLKLLLILILKGVIKELGFFEFHKP